MKDQKNVLLITYYWPPSGGAGVHRWLRFSKYFNANNCNLTVYCPEDAAWPILDQELEKEVGSDIEVIRRKIFEPHKYLSSKGNTGVGFTQEKKQGVVKKMIVWTRGNLFIPDSRIFWIKPSVRFLNKYLDQHPEINTIISTGPPHSMHMIALELKRKRKLKWIADFRDPWTQIDFYEQLLPGEKADRKHKEMEKACLTEADEVITVSNACADGLEMIAQRPIHVITNGFEFPEFDPDKIELDQKFTISHFGTMPASRNPIALWKALEVAIKENEGLKNDLSIRLIGSADYQVIESAKDHGVADFIEQIPPISHQESIQAQRSTQLLLLVANTSGNVKGILTGKFFEYLGAKRPILAVGQRGSDLENAVLGTNCGYFSDFNGEIDLKDFIIASYTSYKNNALIGTSTNLEQYHSSTLAKKIIDLI